MGYSVSSAEQFPSIWYTGRLAGDPLNEMSQGENTIIEGTGSQDGGAARWGDYSSMVTDPTDQCTFWYTTEYIADDRTATWQTRDRLVQVPELLDRAHGHAPRHGDRRHEPARGRQGHGRLGQHVTDASGAYTFTLPVGTPTT